MHAKTDSDVSHVTSMGTISPPRSPPPPGRNTNRAVYYVESPSFSHDLDKCSYDGATLSPNHPSPSRNPYSNYHYHCSPVHHSRESSTSRFFSSSNLKLHGGAGSTGWRRIYGARRVDDGGCDDGDDDDDDGGGSEGHSVRFYVGCFVVSFLVLFSTFALILWGASKSFHPRILVKNMVFLDFTIQAGMDGTGVPTDMLSLNSTVKIYYKNPATFFGVHVTSSPLQLHYYNLKVASGQMNKFYQKRKSHSNRTAVVHGYQVPLYGGMLLVSNARAASNSLHTEKVNVALNLTFTVRSRAYILGRLVKSKFYTNIRCPVTLHGSGLGKPMNLHKSCIYDE